MIIQTPRPASSMQGVIRRRLLVNAVVDPDEAASRLPDGVRPHVTGRGTVVGCCLLEIGAIRPKPLPSAVGRNLRAVAHRISAEWIDADGHPVTGVYVPVRHTDSQLAIAIGGRLFPGVHERARMAVSGSDARLRWQSEPRDPAGHGIMVGASFGSDAQPGVADNPVGGTCLGAVVGVSPNHRGQLEAARMDLSHHNALEVTIEDFESRFIDGFSTAEMSTSYLMSDVDVVWTRATAPAPKVGAMA